MSFRLKILFSVLIFSAFLTGLSSNLKELGFVELGGKPVHMFPDSNYNRLYVINYETNEVDVINSLIFKKERTLKESSYPVFVSLSKDYIIVSDFWGYKLDIYRRSSLDYISSINVRRGPGYSLVRNNLVYFVSQREYYLQVLDLDNMRVSQEFELSGRVPKFYFFGDIAILPYYDNYHTWSWDFEFPESVGFINVSSLFRWNLEGMIKKPLNVLEIEEGKYIITGYLDQGIWEFNWGNMKVEKFIDWDRHSHIMDMCYFNDYVVVPSMSDENLFYARIDTKSVSSVPSSRGVMSVLNYEDEYLFALSNFENKILIYDKNMNKIEEHNTGDYPISMCVIDDKLFVLCMDDARIDVMEIW